jgi:hypothetical protein
LLKILPHTARINNVNRLLVGINKYVCLIWTLENIAKINVEQTKKKKKKKKVKIKFFFLFKLELM